MVRFRPSDPQPGDNRRRAREFVTKALVNGPRQATELESEALAQGIPRWAYLLARRDLGVVWTRAGRPGRFGAGLGESWLSLPEPPA